MVLCSVAGFRARRTRKQGQPRRRRLTNATGSPDEPTGPMAGFPVTTVFPPNSRTAPWERTAVAVPAAFG
jgi:hypothetical protein